MNEFPQADSLVYLNHAAVSPWPRRCYEAVERFARENIESGAQHYPQWLVVESELRDMFRGLVNASSSDDIALLKNTSEALSVVAHGLDWHPGDNVVLYQEEFISNRVVWDSLERYGVEIRYVSLKPLAESPEQALLDATDSHTRLISVSSVQYASGLRMDLARIGEFCRSRDILYCVDAIQSLGALDLDVQAIRADFLMADGHKWLLGPEGLAGFYTRPEVRDCLKLNQYGWHMLDNAGDTSFLSGVPCGEHETWRPAMSARRFECGSPNMLGVYALHASLSLILETGIDKIEARLLESSVFLLESLERLGAQLLTPKIPGRFAGIVTFDFPDINIEQLYAYLQENQVICSLRGGGIRFSPHFYLPRHKLEMAIDYVSNFLHK